tara:strand:+ start:300 stop:905 length:606 start_codon:yes stop_codon:yes gene_type:complete
MKSLYRFIVKPLTSRYENTKSINGDELVLNTNIEDHRFVSKRAIVISTPKAYNTDIKEGDEVVVHHNVFRRFYDMRGEENNSASYFKEDMFFCDITQLYLYKNKDIYRTNLNYCFIKPLKNKDNFSIDKELPLKGIVKYSNKQLESVGISEGDLITFTPNSEFEFWFGSERLYCMKSNDIALTHEYEGNEEEYNPSWANRS